MINLFGRLNLKLHDLEDEHKQTQELINNVQDAANELLLADDDTEVKYQMGEVYVDISKDEADAIIQKEEEKFNSQLQKIANEIEEIKKILAELKVKLYGKFGSSINLEE